jgi:hypothetical protein
MGPTVQVMPGPGKPFDAFQYDQSVCKQFTEQTVGGQADNANVRGVDAAALTTVLEAGLGAAIGGGRGATIGAGGLKMGVSDLFLAVRFQPLQRPTRYSAHPLQRLRDVRL